MSKSIPLSQGKVALVDDADYDRLAAYRWFLSGPGYAVGFVPSGNGRFRLEYMHRLIMQPADGQLVDHINGDSLDNRQTNLRFATPQQNLQNKRLSSLSCTGLKGVGWHKERRKFHARIQLQGIRYHLGFFEDAETAALAYDCAAKLLFGEFAACNYADRQTPQAVATAVRERLQRRGWPPE
jgi:hypothetical protein